jgi:glycerol-3-phosphate dehydrogenase
MSSDFTLIGTTDADYQGDVGKVAINDAEIGLSAGAASEYFQAPRYRANRSVWTYSGIRPLYDDGASEAKDATRDYVLELDQTAGGASLLSVFGGKITTYPQAWPRRRWKNCSRPSRP